MIKGSDGKAGEATASAGWGAGGGEFQITAHDFRNLLQCAMSGIRVARARLRGEGEDQPATLLDDAIAALERAAALSRRLDNAAPAVPHDRTPVDVEGIILALVKRLRPALGPAVQVETRISASTPRLACDAALLENALINLALNARDAMPAGGLIVIDSRARLCRARADGAAAIELCISVADTGCGMSGDVHGMAMRPGFTTKAAAGGSGIGLASVADFARRLGGVVEIDTAPGTGTCVRLLLPAAEVEGHRREKAHQSSDNST